MTYYPYNSIILREYLQCINGRDTVNEAADHTERMIYLRQQKCSWLAALLAVSVFCVSCPISFAAEGDMGRFKKQQTYTQQVFTDISPDAWYYQEVANLYCFGLTGGVGDNQFAPDGLVSIAEVITYACRIHSLYYDIPIADTVGSGEWY